MRSTVAAVFLTAIIAMAQTENWSPIHTRPLEQVRLLLENQYENVVTYEDPVWNWIADSYAVGNEPGGPFGRLLWDRHLDLPTGVARAENGKLDADLVQRFIDAYHQQNPNDARFKVLQSSLGLHIVPPQVHDESGALVPGLSVLDTRIEVQSSPQAFVPNGSVSPRAGATGRGPNQHLHLASL